tara:strand:- start:71975 stop:72904 length:930 start_codon:yes stop_codon:yes gene_type:complete
MKSIMYHYIQPFNQKFKKFEFLHFKHFEKQLNFFKKKYVFFDCYELFEKSNKLDKKIFLTFDDGLACHYDYVFKILKRNKINGIFYIPTLPFQKGKILDVHKIHLILGKIGPQKAFEELKKIIGRNKNFVDNKLKLKYEKKIYEEQKNYFFSRNFKSYLNYFIKKNYRPIVIKKLFRKVFQNNEKKICKNFYLNEKQINHMIKENMIIGSHSVNHKIMSELSINKMKDEINKSFDFINMFIKEKTFSYPYGGYHSFNKQIEKYLSKSNVSFSMNVENKDISKNDLTKRRQALPRIDCNNFPYGQIYNKI